ncbi:MAG TPA: hypothetical protein VM345_06430 [Acidimicrobiales bacterium]|nr:hypothetical protein [Acidimicrobiales bacterium]
MTAAALASNLLAALSWDPQVRGFLIFLTSFVILCGSVYLLVATNTGARLGFLIAGAGLFGWCALMGWIWVIYGIGIRGDDPHWEVKEVITGDVAANSAVDKTKNFPNGWEKLEQGNPILGDATATADAVLTGESGEGGHGGGEVAAAPAFPAVFEAPEQYVQIAGYRTGGEDYWIPGGYLERNQTPFRGWLHQPHYTVIQVQATIPPDEDEEGSAPAEPVVDPDAPITSVVMERNLGNLRQPSALFGLANTILFIVFCVLLHRRDKQIMATRAAGSTAPAAA